MKKCAKLLLLFTVIILTTCSSAFAQTYGKIYTKEEANSVYGPVKFSVPIKTAELRQLLAKTRKYVLFNILNNKLNILTNQRKPIKSDVASFSAQTEFKAYSVSVVEELLDKGMQEDTYVEQRSDVLSVTNGAYTMEMAAACPPLCPEID